MVCSQSNGGGTGKGIVLSVCLAAGLAVAAWGAGAGRSEAAGFAAPEFTARGGIVSIQTAPKADKSETDKKAKSTEEGLPAKKIIKRRAIRCGGPGLPDCPL
jgi:hypothetical protein